MRNYGGNGSSKISSDNGKGEQFMTMDAITEFPAGM
jgi:hypothetical protein